jgi:hypothetical protein
MYLWIYTDVTIHVANITNKDTMLVVSNAADCCINRMTGQCIRYNGYDDFKPSLHSLGKHVTIQVMVDISCQSKYKLNIMAGATSISPIEIITLK